jgi:hypothetical protein
MASAHLRVTATTQTSMSRVGTNVKFALSRVNLMDREMIIFDDTTSSINALKDSLVFLLKSEANGVEKEAFS